MTRILTIFSGKEADKNALHYSQKLTQKLNAYNDVFYFSPEFELLSKFSFGAGTHNDKIYDDFKKKFENEYLQNLREAENIYSKTINPQHSNYSFTNESGCLEDILNEISKYYDLLLVQKNIAEINENYTNIIHTLLFQTNTPTLIIPEDTIEESTALTRPLIAWDGSIRASKAVKSSLTILSKAEEVLVMGVNETEKDISSASQLLKYLETHKIKAKHLGVHELDFCVGKTVLNEAEKRNCDAIIMGAYSHNRIRQAILGGATKYMLKNANIPILMRH